MIDDNEASDNAKCPRCGYCHHIRYAQPEDFSAEAVAENGGYMPVMCEACQALPWELLDEG